MCLYAMYSCYDSQSVDTQHAALQCGRTDENATGSESNETLKPDAQPLEIDTKQRCTKLTRSPP